MARVPLIRADDPDVDPKAAALLRATEDSRSGAVLNVHRALANHPELMEAIFAFGRVAYFRNSLNPIQRELAYYTSAVANDCHY